MCQLRGKMSYKHIKKDIKNNREKKWEWMKEKENT